MRKRLSKDSVKHFLVLMSAAATVTLSVAPTVHAAEDTSAPAYTEEAVAEAALDGQEAAEAEEQNGWVWQDQYWHYYENGQMLKDTTRFIPDEKTGKEDCYRFDAEGRMITGWYQAYGEWYYFNPANGHRVSGFQTINGNTYYFGDAMLADTTLQLDGVIYHFDKDGHMDSKVSVKEDGWVQSGDDWYYRKDGSYLSNKWVLSDGYWYYMDAHGKMVKDGTAVCYDEGTGASYTYGFNHSGRMIANGWCKVDTDWYYFDASGRGAEGVMNVSGETYYFVDGRMICSQAVLSDKKLYYFGKDGSKTWQVEIETDGWYSTKNGYYYIRGGKLVQGEFVQSGGKNYYLGDDGVMYADREASLMRDGKRGDYRFAKNGEMITGWYEGEATYYYSPADGKRCTGLQSIEGSTMYFDEYARLVTGCSVELDGILYYFGQDGKLTKQESLSEEGLKKMPDGTYYAKGGTLLKNGWVQVGDARYYMDENGRRVSNGTYCIEGKYYSFDKDGLIRTGWQEQDGERYYYGTDGQTVRGMQTIDGKKYYMTEEGRVVVNARVVSEGVLYRVGADGVCELYTTVQNGFVDDIYYLKGGKVSKGWEYVSGKWYYFDENYEMVRNANNYKIQGQAYCFGSDGVMKTGWIQTSPNKWEYANSDGALVKGWYFIGGVWYYFDSFYEMKQGLRYIAQEDKYHLFSESGAWISEVDIKKDKWYLDGSDWYYVENGHLVTWNVVKIKDDVYGFDDKMLADTRKTIAGHTYYFGADGRAYRNQWRKDDANVWYYYDEDGYEAQDEWELIGGVWYYFNEDGSMVCDCEKIIDGKVNTFSASGAWTGDNVLMYGWQLLQGNWYFYTNGEALVGWKLINQDTYYFNADGTMAYGTIKKRNGDYYWLNRDGKILNNGWIMTNTGEWCYAGADGKLYVGVHTIDEKEYVFSDKGILYTTNTLSADGSILYQIGDGDAVTEVHASDKDGWYLAGQTWYYAEDGKFLVGRQTIDDIQYYFDSDGAMAYNRYCDGVGYADQSGALHFDGWQGSDKDGWYYLCHGVAVKGAFTVNGKKFVTGIENKEGLYFVDGCYCYLDGNGGFKVQSLKKGWNSVNGNWYYMESDGICRGEVKKINGVYYLFSEEDGRMLSEGLGKIGDTIVYVKNGKLATGWKLLEGKWYFFNISGHALKGTHTINGVSYTFGADGVWIP